MSRIVFGTDRLRSRGLPLLPRSLEQQAFSLLDRSFELGCNTFDTARIYWDSERTLGAWIRQRRNRDEVVVISKGCHPHLLLKRPRLSPDDVTRDLHASLKALDTEFIDLYLLHYDHPAAQVEPIMERLNRHIGEGKIGAIGASNWSHERIATANTFAEREGLKPFGAASAQLSLAEWTRSPWPGAQTLGGDGRRGAREWYASHGLSVFAWSSLARGFFSDHYDPKNPGANRVSRWCATYFGTDENVQRLERARSFAREQHVSVAQVALAWVLCHPLHVFAVVGCATAEKFADNVAALSLKLDEPTLRWLETGQPPR
ncbi:aldo/keto reductase [Mycobacterium sp. 663a-19]|uniref:aldo/keto reductase n=1 Tax=Mycobacterium sp. 663a-19 TaxID=2986148 RepID=UPI002D1ECE05|nr:aldo/keto reductase [Mycobacterium sp. 663a-19]MEB3981991.1 aldo/keto reductase [Mycobacterium sp. 663a-19]